jgi:predicted RNase H-like nuclease
MAIESPPACLLRRHPRPPPLPQANAGGRLQRRLVLYLQGLDLMNPLQVLEEITRHHLLTGQLPRGGLHDHDELDALAAAFTAHQVGTKPERVSQMGDREEGLITLPSTDLKDFYP